MPVRLCAAPLILLTLLTLCLATPAAAQPRPDSYTRAENVVYGLSNGVGLVMDVFTPTGPKNGKAIVDVLSGAWFSEEAQVRQHLQARLFDIYCARGYTVFMVRPGSRTLFPADRMVEHIGRAVTFIRSRASTYGIDPTRIGMTGASAGGHLTLLALATAPGLDIKAAAVFFPPTDFLEWGTSGRLVDGLEGLFFSGGQAGRTPQEIEQKARDISPARRVTRALPPVLLIHGDADPTVPLQQSEKMVRVLKEAGGDARLIVKPGGGHPWMTIAEEVAVMAAWFDEQLAR